MTNERLEAKIDAQLKLIEFQHAISYSVGGMALMFLDFMVFAMIQIKILCRKNTFLTSQNAEILKRKEEIEAQRDDLQARLGLLLEKHKAES